MPDENFDSHQVLVFAAGARNGRVFYRLITSHANSTSNKDGTIQPWRRNEISIPTSPHLFPFSCVVGAAILGTESSEHLADAGRLSKKGIDDADWRPN